MRFAALIPRYLIALVLTVCAYIGYGKFAVPHLEGEPAIANASALPTVTHRLAEDIKLELVGLLPEDSWEWGTCAILESRTSQLLFQEHEMLEDGSIKLTPLTMVMKSAPIVDGDITTQPPPLVLRAVSGAILKFEGDLTATGEPGSLETGQLLGEVQIYRTASSPDRDDSLTLVAQNVQISPERIFSIYDCKFRFGESYGRGKHLTVDLHGPEKKKDPHSTFAGIQRIELSRLYELYLHREKPQPPPITDTLQAPLASQTSDPNAEQSSGDMLGDMSSSFLITSDGPMTFDFDTHIANFQTNVLVRSVSDPGDELSCDQLNVFMQPAATPDDSQNISPPILDDKNPDDKISDRKIQVTRLQAVGTPEIPAVITSQSQNAQAIAEQIDFDLVNQQVSMSGLNKVSLTRNGQFIQAPKINYTFTEDGRLGSAVMTGPGTIRQPSQDPNQEDFVCQWQNKLTLQDDNGKKVLSLDQASIQMADTSVDANRIHLWMWEISEIDESGKESWRFAPAKLFADGKVQIRSPRVSGNCVEAAAFWPTPELQPQATLPTAGFPRRRQSVVVARPVQEQLQQAVANGGNRVAQGSWQQEQQPNQRQTNQTQTSQPLAWQTPPPPAAISWQPPVDPTRQTTQASVEWQTDSTYPVQPAAYVQEESLAPLQSTWFVGLQVQLQMAAGQSGEFEELTVDGDVVVQQRQILSNGSQKTTLEIRGQKLRVIAQDQPQSLRPSGAFNNPANQPETSNQHRIIVAGSGDQLAEVAAEELLLQGQEIHMDQAANRLWIDGPGRMQLESVAGNMTNTSNVSTAETDSASTESAGTTHVDWKGGMVFDGRKLYFETLVESHSRQTNRTDRTITTTTTRGAALSIILNRKIDFTRVDPGSDLDAARNSVQPQSNEQPYEAEKLVMVGWMESGEVAFPKTWQPAEDRQAWVATGKYDASGNIISNQEVYAPRTTFDVRTGTANCKGPGTVIARQLAKQKDGPSTTLASTRQRQGSIDFVKVDFENTFSGNSEKKELNFVGNVHTFYDEVNLWDSVPAESSIRRPESRGTIMDCDRLTMVQWTPQSAEPTIEMIAMGNARVKGSQYDAQAERISYYQTTGQVVIEAPTRSDAKLSFARPGQTNRGNLVAKKITYNLATGEVQMQEYKQLDYSQKGPIGNRNNGNRNNGGRR